jgi:hypothetical protein
MRIKMAVKKFLTENGKQVWPITRADCIYTVAGDTLLSDDYASKDYIDNEIAKLRDEMVVLEEDDLSIDGLVDQTFPELTTINKTLTGAINEINNKMQNNQPGEGQVEEIEKSEVDEILMDVFGVVIDEEAN